MKTMTKSKDQVVTEGQLANILEGITKTQKIGLTHRKKVDMYKAGNPLYGRVEVVQTFRGQINVNYEKSVQKATGDTES